MALVLRTTKGSALTHEELDGNFEYLDEVKGAATEYLLYQERQVTSTDAGSATSGSWAARALNTEVEDTGDIGSVASNQVTLPAGTYLVKAMATANQIGVHALRLYNVTDSAVVVVGMACPEGANAYLVGKFTIAASKTFELQHRCSTTKADDGLGVATGFASHEMYSFLELVKVA